MNIQSKSPFYKQPIKILLFLFSAQILLSSFTFSRFHKRAESLFQKVISSKEVYDAAIVTGMPVDNGKLNKTVTYAYNGQYIFIKVVLQKTSFSQVGLFIQITMKVFTWPLTQSN